MLGDLFRVKLDEANDQLVVELKDGTAAKQYPLGKVTDGKATGHVDVDANGYVLAVRVDGLKEAMAELFG